VRPVALPSGGGVAGLALAGIFGSIPEEFLGADDDFFESGYESEEEDEYP
jgi:hypothetical protein